MIHVVIFLCMGSLFAVMYSLTSNDPGCLKDQGQACNFYKTAYKSDKVTDYSVQDKFSAIFEFGIATYFADAIFRLIVVMGLKYN